jgi:hypothetical protein
VVLPDKLYERLFEACDDPFRNPGDRKAFFMFHHFRTMIVPQSRVLIIPE